MIEALTVDAVSTIHLLESIEALYPMLVLHVFLDNARYHTPSSGGNGSPGRGDGSSNGQSFSFDAAITRNARHVCLIDWNADLGSGPINFLA
jgi:hypothetical protein